MKSLKYIGLGLFRIVKRIVFVITMPLWIPIVILHNIGCDNEEDLWLNDAYYDGY